MAYEVAITKWHSGVLIDIETREKVMKKYGSNGESKSEAIAKALDEAVKDVKLTKAELKKVQDEYAENLKKRMKRREFLKANGKTSVSRRKK